MGSSNNDQPVRDDSPKTDTPMRWIRYISADRRVLWHEYPGAAIPPPYVKSIPDAHEWKATIDAAFATRLPQRNAKVLAFEGCPRSFTLKIFPDYGSGGVFKGVIQIVELRDRDAPKPSDTTVIGMENREIHSILDLTLSGVILYRPDDDRIQNVNRRLAQETGYAVSDLEGMPGRILFGDDGVALLKNIHQRMTNAGNGIVWGQALTISDRKGRKERHFCSFLLMQSQSYSRKDNVLYISLTGTEKDEAEDIVRAGPDPRFVMEALQEGLWEYDTQKHLYYYNPAFEPILGPDGLPGREGKTLQSWIDALYPGDGEKIVGSWRKLLKKGERYRTFYRIRDCAGEWRWIVATIHAILNDAQGRPSRIIGFHMDITDAMRSEKELSDVEERLRVIFENSGVGIGIAETDGRIRRVNPALALMLGRDWRDFDERRLSEFAHPRHGPEIRACRDRIMQGGRRELVQDVLFTRPDGREVWANLTFSLSRKVSRGDRYIIITAEDVTSAHLSREKLQYEATHDVMTGAWTRWVLFERLGQHINLAIRHRQPMTYCLCDLDHFKLLNDIHGHQAGDQALVRFVEIMKRELRDTDVIGRYGGEEFGVVFPNTAIPGAVEPLERVLEALRKETFTDGNGDSFQVTVTVGVTGVTPGCDMQQVVARADEALYAGKAAGRDRIVVAETPEGGWI